MKTRLLFVILSFISSAFAAERPNFIFFLTDDVSFDDIGPYGNTFVKTPNLDRMAAEGMVFDRAYLTISSCSPSRCSMITGRYPHNTGAPELHMPLPADQVTFIQQLKEGGYHTILSGKNHMGDAKALGFTEVSGGKGPSASESWVEILKHRPKDQPFFAWFGSNDAHRGWDLGDDAPVYDPAEIEVPPYMVDGLETRKDLAAYYGEVSRSDAYIGKLMAELQRQGIEKNTYLVYCTDNGRPFPRCKTRSYDSGMKTPLIIWKPGSIQPARTNSLTSAIDFAPTFLELAGINPSPTIQGVSLVPILKDPKATVRDFAFSERNWHVYSAHERSVRYGDWLYIKNAFPHLAALSIESDHTVYPAAIEYWEHQRAGTLNPLQMDVQLVPRPSVELYRTNTDPHQFTNLADQPEHQEIQTKLAEILAQWTAQTGDTVPEKPTPTRKKGDPHSFARTEIPGATKQAESINHPGPVLLKADEK
ncbi:MAG: sulfatase [Verrucomicrobiota bacterium]